MTKLTLETIQILDAIDRRGSFALAAEEFFRVPASISYAIQNLENQLDVKIFSRQGHRAQLTPIGKLLLKEGRALLHAADNLELKIKMQQTGWEDHIVIAYDQIIPFKNLIFLIEDFYQQAAQCSLSNRLRSKGSEGGEAPRNILNKSSIYWHGLLYDVLL